MGDIRTRVLSEDDWRVVRDLRLEALRESPGSFVAKYDEELEYNEGAWRERVGRARWLIAERDGKPLGVVGLGTHGDDPHDGEIFGLWVPPQARRSRVGWALVRAAAEQAIDDGRDRLFFWVGSDNGPAVAFASAFGFRPTSQRRVARGPQEMGAADEVAMVTSLEPDPTSVRNAQLP